MARCEDHTESSSTSAASDASRLLRRQSVDVLVIDPLFGVRAPRVAATSAEILALGVEFPFLPVLFYSSDPATALPLIARYPSRECREAIVAGIDDDSSALAQAMERLKNESLVYQVLRPLAERLRDAPPTMVRVLTDVFTTPRLFDTAEQLASAACMSRRSLDRWLTRRQIGPSDSTAICSSGDATYTSRAGSVKGLRPPATSRA